MLIESQVAKVETHLDRPAGSFQQLIVQDLGRVALDGHVVGELDFVFRISVVIGRLCTLMLLFEDLGYSLKVLK